MSAQQLFITVYSPMLKEIENAEAGAQYTRQGY
jgi:hypothetical protein